MAGVLLEKKYENPLFFWVPKKEVKETPEAPYRPPEPAEIVRDGMRGLTLTFISSREILRNVIFEQNEKGLKAGDILKKYGENIFAGFNFTYFDTPQGNGKNKPKIPTGLVYYRGKKYWGSSVAVARGLDPKRKRYGAKAADMMNWTQVCYITIDGTPGIMQTQEFEKKYGIDRKDGKKPYSGLLFAGEAGRLLVENGKSVAQNKETMSPENRNAIGLTEDGVLVDIVSERKVLPEEFAQHAIASVRERGFSLSSLMKLDSGSSVNLALGGEKDAAVQRGAVPNYMIFPKQGAPQIAAADRKL